MGLVAIVAGSLCRCLLRETKGTFTAESYEDNTELKKFQKSWSPQVTRRRRDYTEKPDEEDYSKEKAPPSSAIDITGSDEYEVRCLLY